MSQDSKIAQILQAIINGSTDYPDFNDNPPSKIALLLMALGVDIAAIKEIVLNLPDALVPKGTLGTNPGDLPDLPTTGNEVGDTYFVATAGTYNNVAANIGDMFYYNDSHAWSYVPTGDVNTWRNILVNNTEVLGIDNKEPLRIINGSNIDLRYNFDTKVLVINAKPIDDDEASTAYAWSGKKTSDELDKVKIKNFEYTGDGNDTVNITFPDTPTFILSIIDTDSPTYLYKSDSFYFGQSYCGVLGGAVTSYTGQITILPASLAYNGNVMSLTAANAARALNTLNHKYKVYYI